MVVKIRLTRMGKKKKPFYRLVVADSRAPRDGKFIEILGYYDPLPEPPVIRVDEEKALLWLERGAQPSDTAKRLLSRVGVWDKFCQAKEARKRAKVSGGVLGEGSNSLSGKVSG
ncbi:MAG: 30S ribosomal protein S16 [Synergistetes bacterium]|nr:30S ribosomal protein S16 [Synergistota bacterium]MDW8192316.1 30S ribosomal protein S16 [Synergistota bacterium]